MDADISIILINQGHSSKSVLSFVERFNFSVYTHINDTFWLIERKCGMEVQVSDYIDVEAKALELGCTMPEGLMILPRNFATAASSSEFIHEDTTPTIRTLLRQAHIQETRIEKEGEKIPYSVQKSWEWVGPIIFVSQWMLTNAALPVTINLISNYLYDIRKGYRDDANATIEYVVETFEKTKHSEKRIYKRITIKGSPNDIKKFGVEELKQLIEKPGK